MTQAQSTTAAAAWRRRPPNPAPEVAAGSPRPRRAGTKNAGPAVGVQRPDLPASPAPPVPKEAPLTPDPLEPCHRGLDLTLGRIPAFRQPAHGCCRPLSFGSLNGNHPPRYLGRALHEGPRGGTNPGAGTEPRTNINRQTGGWGSEKAKTINTSPTLERGGGEGVGKWDHTHFTDPMLPSHKYWSQAGPCLVSLNLKTIRSIGAPYLCLRRIH